MMPKTKGSMKATAVLIPKLMHDTLNEASVGLLRVHEQLQATCDAIADGTTTNLAAVGHETGYLATVVEALMCKLDGVIEGLDVEPREATDARILEAQAAARS